MKRSEIEGISSTIKGPREIGKRKIGTEGERSQKKEEAKKKRQQNDVVLQQRENISKGNRIIERLEKLLLQKR